MRASEGEFVPEGLRAGDKFEAVPGCAHSLETPSRSAPRGSVVIKPGAQWHALDADCACEPLDPELVAADVGQLNV